MSDTPKTDTKVMELVPHVDGPAIADGRMKLGQFVPADFARAQERRIAAHVDLMIRLKDHMERMGFCTREEEPYLEELEDAIQKGMQP